MENNSFFMDISFYVLSFRVPLIISACPVRYNQIIIKIIIHIFQFFGMCYRIPANLFRMLFQDLSPSLISGECLRSGRYFLENQTGYRRSPWQTLPRSACCFSISQTNPSIVFSPSQLICCKKYKCFRIVCFLQPVFYSPGCTVPAFR